MCMQNFRSTSTRMVPACNDPPAKNVFILINKESVNVFAQNGQPLDIRRCCLRSSQLLHSKLRPAWPRQEMIPMSEHMFLTWINSAKCKTCPSYGSGASSSACQRNPFLVSIGCGRHGKPVQLDHMKATAGCAAIMDKMCTLLLVCVYCLCLQMLTADGIRIAVTVTALLCWGSLIHGQIAS